ncbi:malonate decarboxylase holo-[acyl-carrier-protein] synthase [Stenotrophomonas pavanii]|uniref:malonate decarboxylase holo-[acyl-carrier-protein] synthase n=1 Tax=Stenotrophomonas pavanii TaxID=487698 RepID=UPI00070E308B|nr:malonate decarboxylase holo-[acyl-carrier-protein] synthase [Stenotrophomonas pavanii]KRG80495.1 phosphoribosyl-dephospho-CoA transferase [Stenotrophomonas pavanii]MEC4340979.1 malonate decarboxylase holo-[acyl-carrier-protein] synthase [Stenotrophomonas pavanii]
MPERLPRHTLVWLSAYAGWQADIAAHEPRLAAWFAQGLPAIVARRAADDADPRLRLGVPLPPAEGKLRLALRVPAHDVLRTAPPPALQAVLEGDLVQDWQRPLQALQDIAAARVFGAFAWQHLTGLRYVHARSDIDLLWRIDTTAQADALAARLQAWETRYGRRVDGELCLADGAAVNWREYAGRSREVLVKRPAGAALELRESVFAPAGVSA